MDNSCCGRDTDDVRTKVIKDAFHVDDGTLIIKTLPTLISSSLILNTYLVENAFKVCRQENKHDRIAVATCCASLLDGVL